MRSARALQNVSNAACGDLATARLARTFAISGFCPVAVLLGPSARAATLLPRAGARLGACLAGRHGWALALTDLTGTCWTALCMLEEIMVASLILD